MDTIDGLQNILILVALVAFCIAIVRSGIGGAIVNAWCIMAMILRACVHVPWGLLLLVIGTAIIWDTKGNMFGLLIGGWFVFKGGHFLFGALAGFGGIASNREPGTRDALRRAGMLGRR